MNKLFLALAILILLLGSSCSNKNTQPLNEEKKIKIIPFGRFTQVFNDLNDKQLLSAQQIGVKPVTSRVEAKKHKGLQEITSCELYRVDSLTHSIPFLVPRAKALLDTIGKNFIDSLENKGAGSYQVVITSILRAENDIVKLRKRNGNASENSAHRFGTTFDIAYARFERIDTRYIIPQEHLKHVLAEVLRDLRKKEKCYVKYEVKQGCFHVTSR